MAASIADSLPAEVTCQTVFMKLSDIDFIACQACGEAPSDGFCLFDDGLSSVYQNLAECDCLLVGTPIYFDTVSAQLKAFIDRCNCFRPADFDNVDPKHDFIKLLSRKRPGAMVLVGGERGYFEGARRVIAGWFKWVEVVNQGHLIYHSPDFRKRGTAADDERALQQARETGRRMADVLIETNATEP